MEPLTCRSMALILFRYSYSNWLKIFPAFHSPELKSVQTIRIVSSIITFAVLFKTIQNYFSFFLCGFLYNKFKTTLSETLAVRWTSLLILRRPRGIQDPCKSKTLLTVLDGFQPLANVTKSSILYVAGDLDPTVIFILQWCILINLKPIFFSYKNRSVNPNEKENYVIGI